MTTKTKYKTKKKLVLPVLNAKMKTGDSIAFKVLDKMYVGKPQKNAKEGEKPADLMHAINIETGEEGLIIIPAVLKSTLNDMYEKDSYVGLHFYLEKGGKPAGKRYFQYIVNEIEV